MTIASFLSAHKRKMILTFAVGAALTFVSYALTARVYRSEAKIFVRRGRESVALDPTATTGAFVAHGDPAEREVYAVQEILTSRGLAEKVVELFGEDGILEGDSADAFAPSPPRFAWLSSIKKLNPLSVGSLRDKAVQTVLGSLSVASRTKTTVLAVHYECGNPRFAQRVLEAVVRVASDEHVRIHRTGGSQEFFVGQSKKLEATLDQLEERLRNLKNTSGVVSLPTQRTLELQRLGSLQESLIRDRAERDAVEAELRLRRAHVEAAPAMSVTEQTTGQSQSAEQLVRQRLYDLEIIEQEQAAKLTDKHPHRQMIRDQLAEARRISLDVKAPVQVRTGLNPAHQAAHMAVQGREANLAALTARIRSIDDDIAKAREELTSLNDYELTINRLEREIDLVRANYRRYAENLEQARINQELEEAKISSLNLMQAPTFSETPVRPKAAFILPLGLACSLLASVGIAILFDQRHSPLPDVDDSFEAFATSDECPVLRARNGRHRNGDAALRDAALSDHE